MRHFGISLAILGLLSAVVFLCLRFAVRIEGHELAELSMLPFVAFGHVSGVIEQRMARKEIMEHGGEPKILQYKNYIKPWPIMLAYAILITAGFSQAAGLYLAIVTDMFDIDLPLPALGFLELPFMLFGCFLLGRWIGYRCAKFGLVVAAIAPALCIVADRLFLLLVFGSDEDVQRFLGTGFSYKFLYTTFGGIALYATVAALGFWRGRVRRLARYMAYMFAVLPSDTQEALIGLTHEEITTRFMRPTQPVSPR